MSLAIQKSRGYKVLMKVLYLSVGNHDEIQKNIKEAFTKNEKALHEKWIKKILTNYYDPMYEYQLNRRKDHVSFEGCYDEVIDYIDFNFQ